MLSDLNFFVSLVFPLKGLMRLPSFRMRLFRRHSPDSFPQLVSLSPLRTESPTFEDIWSRNLDPAASPQNDRLSRVGFCITQFDITFPRLEIGLLRAKGHHSNINIVQALEML